MVGYQGESSRLNIQRQSGSSGRRVQTGLASAPARCATAVSTEMIRSRLETSAAVSVKSSRSLVRSVMFMFEGASANCLQGSPFWRL